MKEHSSVNYLLSGSIFLLMSLTLFCLPGMAYDTETPTKYDIEKENKKMENVGIDMAKKGEALNLNLSFTNEAGETKSLGSFFKQGKPVLLSMVYYECPSLCGLHMNGVTAALKDLELKAGQDFNWITVSMDPKEGHQLALDKKENYIKNFAKKDEARQGWNFLVGSEENVKELTSQLGFTYKWDAESEQFAHSSAIYVISNQGQISQIISGVEFDPKTLKLALIEASEGKVGSFIDRAMMMCFAFNPKKNKYTIYAYNIMKIGALLTLFLLGVFLLPSWISTLRSKSK